MTRLTESQIRTIARIARDELGNAATLEQLREVVQLAVEKLERQGPIGYKTQPAGRVLAICISTDGLMNSRVLSEATRESGCKVIERFERKMSEFHVLLAVIDPSVCSEDFETLRASFADTGNAAGVRIVLQPEDSLVRNASDE